MSLICYIKRKTRNAIIKFKRFLFMRKIEKSKDSISQFKNKYKGERCFVIGNGPSLTVNDLEKLKGEKTFASHGIYYIYDKTDWRPTFYCAQDAKFIREKYDVIKNSCSESINFFGVVSYIDNYPKFAKESFLVNLIIEDFVDNGPKFSEDLSIGAYEGLTVTYLNIQLAVYMGFKEIYLLGVDHFYSGDENDHFSKRDICTNKPQTEKSTYSYRAANKYANENGIKIYNATRGGHLEEFERVNFDEIIRR